MKTRPMNNKGIPEALLYLNDKDNRSAKDCVRYDKTLKKSNPNPRAILNPSESRNYHEKIHVKIVTFFKHAASAKSHGVPG